MKSQLVIMLTCIFLKIIQVFSQTKVQLNKQNQKTINEQALWKFNSLVLFDQDILQIGISLWFKTQQCKNDQDQSQLAVLSTDFSNLYLNQQIIIHIQIKKDKVLCVEIGYEENNTNLYLSNGERKSLLKLDCIPNNWILMVITIQQDIYVQIYSSKNDLYKESNQTYEMNYQIIYKSLRIQVSPTNNQMIKLSDLSFYYTKQDSLIHTFQSFIAHSLLLEKNYLEINKSYNKYEQEKQIKVVIISFYLVQYDYSSLKQEILFNFNTKDIIIIQRDINQTIFIFQSLNKQFLIGNVENKRVQITIQIELDIFIDYEYLIQFYINDSIKEDIRIKLEQDYLQGQFHKQINQYQNSRSLNGQKFFIVSNYKINQFRYQSQKIDECMLQAYPISRQLKNSQLCIFYQIKKSDKQFKKLSPKRQFIRRSLQSIQFIHGDDMKSIVKNMYSSSQTTSIITNAQLYNTIKVIGYFKLSQTISGTQYLPLITIGIQSDYYNFLNLYIINNTTVELKYIHDTNNQIIKQSKTLTNLQNVWISLGIVYSKVNQKAKLIYSDSNSKLISSTSITGSLLPLTISTLDVCISCVIVGGIFGHFIGQVSTVKIIYNVDYDSTDNYYLFNEQTTINKTPILGQSFNINTYVQNSEYDVQQGFICNSGYAFFQGICINSNICKNLISDQDIYSSFEIAKYYDSSSKKCLNCGSNCLQCNSISECIICRPGYKIQNGICIRCDVSNTCTNSCVGQQIFDPMNQICVDRFDPISQTLFIPLLSSRIINDNSDIQVVSSPPFSSMYEQIVHCYIDVDNNSMTLHSFLGGLHFTDQTVLSKQWIQVPSGYQKSVSFYALFYGNGNHTNLKVQINQNTASLDQNYQTIISNKISCSGSGSQTQSIFKVKFTILDYSNTFNLTIISFSNFWGIRNLNIEISKCHPTCDTCKSGGSSKDCTSCKSNLTENRFQCNCPYGQYAKYMNCFDSSCVVCSDCIESNCKKCEDITGKCIECNSNYIIKDGQCILNSQCNTNDKVFSKFCGVSIDNGFTHFKQDRIIQYTDYWQFNGNNITVQPCNYTRQCVSLICVNRKHTLNMVLPKYQFYHYNLTTIIENMAFNGVDGDDYIQIYYGSTMIFQKSYSIKQIPIQIFKETITYQQSNSQLQLQIGAQSGCWEEAYSFSQIDFKYVRCHPFCKSCTSGNTESTCTTCIDYASLQSGACQCNNGYYFSLERFPNGNTLPGSCLECNSACLTCTGPSYQDCINCQVGYTKINNICQYNCQTGKHWDQSSQSCLNCHSSCKSCYNEQINSCHDCRIGFVYDIINKSCYIPIQLCEYYSHGFCGGQFQSQEIIDFCKLWIRFDTNSCVNWYYNLDSSSCSSCSDVISSSCGRSEIKNRCNSSGWFLYNSNICLSCEQYVNGNCGGQFSQNIINICFQEGYYNYDSLSCSSCISIISNDCGRNEIKDRCYTDGWTQYNQTKCKNCNKNSLVFQECICDSSCKECNKYFNPNECKSCQQPFNYYNKQCKIKCPNGYTSENQICKACSDKQMPSCVSCYKACFICEPYEINSNANSCTQCSSLTRYLDNGYCKCLDHEDNRESFHECSFQKYAMINAILSNSTSLLSINFGKVLIVPNSFQIDQFSEFLCQYLFTDSTLQFIGQKSQCSISNTYIYVNLDYSSDIFDGEVINFKQNILSFTTSSQVLIEKYFNNIVVQQQVVGQSKVLFEYLQVENSCNSINIKFKKIQNSAERGIKQFSWNLTSYEPSQPNLQIVLQNLLLKATKDKKMDLLIPKVVIQINYTLKANVKGYEEFFLSVKPDKKIFLEIQSLTLNSLYRILIVQSYVKYCGANGDIQSTEPLNFQISSQQFPDINYLNSDYKEKEYMIEIKPYSLNIGKFNATLVSDPLKNSKINYEIEVQQTQLYVKIIGGNRNFNYKKPQIIDSKVRDFDILSETEQQGIQIQWKCIDPNSSNGCLDKLGNEVILFTQDFSVTIEANTFNPYTMIKLALIGQKDTRQQSDFIIMLFSEFNLPPLEIQIDTIDSETVNLNEEIFVELFYNTSVNIDLLSFSGTISYEDEVVGIIKFDYTKLRFQIWNYFSGFRRDLKIFEIRFNVYNPQYYMASTFLKSLTVNFAPQYCSLSATPNVDGFSIQTQFLIQFLDCEDDNEPIYYQFFYYKNIDDFEFEKKNPLQVKRRQLNDKQQKTYIESSLPAGEILILAQAIDSKNAIYNSTVGVTVKQKQYDEQSYLSVIQSKLDKINEIQIDIIISDLSIICEDILQRTEFKSSSLLNFKKIEILNQLQYLQKSLNSLSSFSTVIDKAISVLTESGINQDQQAQETLIDQLIQQLDESSNLKQQNLQLSKEKLKQKLYDSFQVVNSLSKAESNSQVTNKVIEFSDQINKNLFINILPNEDPIIFKGSQMSLLGTQITQKYICQYFYCLNTAELNNSKPTQIYNFKKSEYKDNPYSQDEFFLNYTQSLKNQSLEQKAQNFSVITPSISSYQNGQLDSFQKSAILTFPSAKNESKNMACVSKNKVLGWTKNGCNILLDTTTNTHYCYCSDLQPTTVIEEIEDLFLENKNIQTAFSSDGLSNITNFKDFYKYYAFWLLSLKTIGFIILYRIGQRLDVSDIQSKLNKIKSFNINEYFQSQQKQIPRNKILPQTYNFIEEFKRTKQVSISSSTENIISQSTNKPIQNANDYDENNNILSPQQSCKSSSELILFKQKLNQLDIKLKSRMSNITKSTFSKNYQPTEEIESIDLNADIKEQQIKKSNMLLFENRKQGQLETSNLFVNQNQSNKQKNDDYNFDKDNSNETNELSNTQQEKQITSPVLLNKRQNFRNVSISTVSSINQNNLQNNNSKENYQSKNIQNGQDQQDFNLKDDQLNENQKNSSFEHFKNYNQLSLFKQIIVFHNFFGIFYIFNPFFSRRLRFLVFYIRSIHSLGISLIFDQNYSIFQQVIISVINSVSVMIIIKIIEICFSFRNIFGKILTLLFSLSIISGYLYLILSILSGQTSSVSNQFILSFCLFFFGDLLVFSVCSAFCQRQIAKHILSKQNILGIRRYLYKLIQLQLVLQSIL